MYFVQGVRLLSCLKKDELRMSVWIGPKSLSQGQGSSRFVAEMFDASQNPATASRLGRFPV